MILKKRLVTKIILTLFSNQELSPLDIKTAFSCMKDIFQKAVSSQCVYGPVCARTQECWMY